MRARGAADHEQRSPALHTGLRPAIRQPRASRRKEIPACSAGAAPETVVLEIFVLWKPHQTRLPLPWVDEFAGLQAAIQFIDHEQWG